MNCKQKQLRMRIPRTAYPHQPVHEHQHERRAVLLPPAAVLPVLQKMLLQSRLSRASRSIMAACAALSVILNAAWPDAWA